MGRGQTNSGSARDRLEKKLVEKQNAELRAIEERQQGQAEDFKAEGNKLFTAGNFLGALRIFSEAIELDPKNHVLYSNRSGANLKLLRTRDAVSDAQQCVQLMPQWPKGYSRLGAAFFADRDPEAAVNAYRKGLKLDEANAPMIEGLAQAEKAAEELKAETKAQAEAEVAAEDAADQKEVEPVIGIDLGTTYSCVAVWKDDGVEILKDEDGSRTVPSYVSWTEQGERVIGHRAKANAAKNVTRTVYDVKRIIGQEMIDEAVQKEAKRFPFPVKNRDGKPVLEIETRPGKTQTFSPEEISAMVLGKMKAIAEKSLGRPVTKAVVTVPAYFNDSQRNATKNAGTIAGLEVLRIINEPTAAALAYGIDQKEASSDRGTNVLIFDLGGGTFDATVLRLEAGMFEVKATGGDTRLGGEDFDNNLVDYLVAEFKKKKLDFSDSKNLRKLRAAAERAKREMSVSQSAKVELSIDGEDHLIDVPRAKFESLNMSHFNKCLDTVKAVLKDAAIEGAAIDDIVLVGGSTRIPKIQEMLSGYFGGRQLCRSINPDEAVAFGAAVQGAILSGVRHSSCRDIVLVDVTPLSLGIELEGDVMSIIIPRNSTVPCRKTKDYTTCEDYQSSIDMRIFEGERPCTKDNHLLNGFKIEGVERAKKGEPQIEVSFSLDANGILNVRAMDKKTRASAECVVQNACKGLSPEEIQRMVAEAEQFAKDDAELVRKVELKAEIEAMAFEVSDKHLSEETLDWLQDLDVANCPLATLEARHKELSKAQ